MTNEKELEWYEQEPYMTRGPYSDYYHFDKIVAEAMTMGEVKAWEGARRMIEDEPMPEVAFDREGLSLFCLILDKKIEAKLISLKTP